MERASKGGGDTCELRRKKQWPRNLLMVKRKGQPEKKFTF